MSEWFYCTDFWDLESVPRGPITFGELVATIKEGIIKPETMVCIDLDDQEDWRPADTFAEVIAECPPDLNELARLYVVGCESEEWPEELWWVWEKVFRWVRHLPQLALDLIVQIVKLEPTHEIAEAIATGPLEELLDAHGAVIITRVEEEARRSPLFRYCLAGVWRRTIPDDIWNRLTIALGTQVRY